LAIVRDITERKAAEEALLASESQYQSLFKSISEPVFISGATAGRFLDCNDVASLPIGYSREEIKALKPEELHPLEERAALRNEVSAGGFGTTCAYTHITKFGRRLRLIRRLLSTTGNLRGSPSCGITPSPGALCA
jgi:PAS domain-containing protein